MFGQNSVFGNNFEILRENLRDGDSNFEEEKSHEELRPIEEIPHPYQQIFSEYPCFNPIQSKLIDDVFYTDNSLVVSAPTGSGKTVIFELAIVRILIAFQQVQFSEKFKIVYICPMKALCEERVVDWHKKFSNFGINSISVTGDSDNIDFQSLLNHNLIITTPEKWDCLTRKWRENINLVEIVKLFMIDEIHLLNEECRGSTLETIVCRMKTIETSIDSSHKIRFIAVSATIPNIEDIEEWIGKSNNTKSFKFSDDYRPVKLNKIVLGYSEPPKSNPFRFDMALNYRLHSLMMQYSHGKPTLIFCSTRKLVEMTAKHILQHLTISLKPEQKERLIEVSSQISDTKVKETLVHGVGYHHAGMLPETRRAIENLFRNNELPVLVTTSTLAMGVNLPAHLVIIKSTKCYTNGGFRDYTETVLLQMIGRAGRPQFDTEATALILTTAKDKVKFEKMIGGIEPIESNLHRHLIEHLNAEVVLQTITSLEVAMRWLSSTFLYIRAKKNPRHYGLPNSEPASMDRRLLEMCQIELNKLINAGMITIDQDVLLKATPVGTAMARYYLAFETMKLFTQINGGEILQQILGLISKCSEFSEMYLRVNDKKCLNLLNKCRNRQTIRFPLNGKIKTLDMKINCIIQAVLGCLDICDHSILTETLKIMRNGERIVKCLIEYLEPKEKCYQALLSTIILSKCFHVKLWENSPYVSKQLPGIGTVMSSQFVNAGKTTFQLISECDPREIELLLNKKAPAGNKILEQIKHLPKYEIKLEILTKTQIKLIVSLLNGHDLETRSTVNRNSLMYLLVGDSFNNILLYEKYSHSYFIENPEVVKTINFQDTNLEFIEAHFISEDWVGIDCTAKYEKNQKPKTLEPKTKTPVSKKTKNDGLTYMQTFMQMYMNCCKNEQPGQERKKTETEVKKPENVNNKIVIHSNILLNKENDSEMNTTRSDFNNSSLALPKYNFTPSRDTSKNTNIKSEEFDIKQFQYTPRKKLSNNKREFSWNSSLNTSLVEPSPKKINFEEKSKNNTKITWRSPLTYSPPVKFSPKTGHNRLNLSNGGNECLGVSNQTSFSNDQSQRPQTQVVNFPLTDDEAFSSLQETKRKEILDKIGDIVSTSFLESFGLISPRVNQKNSNLVMTANEHYNQLLSQESEISGKPSQKNVLEKPKLDESVNDSNRSLSQKCEIFDKPKLVDDLNRSFSQKDKKSGEKNVQNRSFSQKNQLLEEDQSQYFGQKNQTGQSRYFGKSLENQNRYLSENNEIFEKPKMTEYFSQKSSHFPQKFNEYNSTPVNFKKIQDISKNLTPISQNSKNLESSFIEKSFSEFSGVLNKDKNENSNHFACDKSKNEKNSFNNPFDDSFDSLVMDFENSREFSESFYDKRENFENDIREYKRNNFENKINEEKNLFYIPENRFETEYKRENFENRTNEEKNPFYVSENRFETKYKQGHFENRTNEEKNLFYVPENRYETQVFKNIEEPRNFQNQSFTSQNFSNQCLSQNYQPEEPNMFLRNDHTSNDFYDMRYRSHPSFYQNCEFAPNLRPNFSERRVCSNFFPRQIEPSPYHRSQIVEPSYYRSQMDNSDGYRYIRSVMEPNYVPFDYRHPQNYVSQQFRENYLREKENVSLVNERLNDFDDSPESMSYLERDTTFVPNSDFLEVENSQNSQMGRISDFQYFDEEFDAKQYIMNKFLNSVQQERRGNYFP